MSDTDVTRRTEKFHNTIISTENPHYSRVKARIAGEQAYFTGKPCKKGHMDWRNTSTGQCKTCMREYFHNNPKAYYDKTAGWVAKNPMKRREALRKSDAKRRSQKLGNGGEYTAEEIDALFKKQRGKCANCNSSILKSYHADHIMPLALGGENYIKNIQLLCPPCNLRKWAKHPIDWARENGRLL